MIGNTAIQPGLDSRIPQQYRAGNTYGETQKRGMGKADFSFDTITLSSSAETVITYNGSMTLQGVRNDGFDLLRGLVIKLFKEQGISLNIPTGKAGSGMKEVSIEEITPEEAEELVAEDGYYGVEQTSDRIVEFAIGIAGGDPARIDAIRAGVEKGFNEAKRAFGDWLPEISYNTFDKVMEKLDDWVNSTTALQA